MQGPVGGVSLPVSDAGFERSAFRASPAVKRIVDLLICLLAAPFVLAAGVMIALALKLDGGSVFYAQPRVGANGRPFACLKFRSMVRDADERLRQVLAGDPQAREEWQLYQKLTDDPRVTWFGRFLRASSLDELPQLINVWRGDMSVVGPRPIMLDQVALYGENFGNYCAVKPGITGLWQISGRNQRTFAERVRLDAQYADSWSLAGDARIILLTLPVVFARRGAK
ncbi:MAG TPA: sugar transferase [Rhizomicrobium sp.]